MDFDRVEFSDHMTIQIIKVAHEGDAFSQPWHTRLWREIRSRDIQDQCRCPIIGQTERAVQTGVRVATHRKYGKNMSIEKF